MRRNRTESRNQSSRGMNEGRRGQSLWGQSSDESGMSRNAGRGRNFDQSRSAQAWGQSNQGARNYQGRGFDDRGGLGMGMSRGQNRDQFGGGVYGRETFGREDENRGYFGKGPKGWRRSEERIKEDVCEALYRSSEVDASDIEVSIEADTVILKGTVDSRESKRAAEECIEELSGVQDVRNELRVKRADASRSSTDTDLSRGLGNRSLTDEARSTSLS